MAQTALARPYPVEWEADVVLRDGAVAHLRPIRPEDAEGLQKFHMSQSDESIYLRFFAPIKQLSQRDLHRFTHVDHHERVALVATHRGAIIGVGRYDRLTPTDAEVAFNISDRHQGKGIGSVLLEHLAAIGREEGLTSFSAEVLPQNSKMLKVFADAGYTVSRRVEDGIVLVHFDIEPTAQSELVRLSREHRAESVSIARLLNPTVIAVVGASRTPGEIGHELLRHVQDGGFTGQVFAVNPNASEVLGVASYRRVSEIPAQVDLVIVAVRAALVFDVVEDCANANVHGLVVVSAGFAESGAAGLALEKRLLRLARDSGMRVLGPTSFGLINTAAEASMNASLAPSLPPGGHFGLFAQSGPLGIAVLQSAGRRHLGLSIFCSAGNRLDVSSNDLMQYFIDDVRTHAVGLYLESMGNPRKFSRIARRLSMVKPVIVIIPHLSRFGAPPGHRVRETKVPPEAFTAMMTQAGVIHVDSIHQMFDIAQVLIYQPAPAGNRVGIVGNSAQLCRIAAETASGSGLNVAREPVTVPPNADLAEFAGAVREMSLLEDIDSVLLCFTPPIEPVRPEAIDRIREVVADSDKTCVATTVGMVGLTTGGTRFHLPARDEEGGDIERPARQLPLYSTPEDAVRALAATTHYTNWRRTEKGLPLPRRGLDRVTAEELVDQVLAEDPDGRELTQDEAEQLLAAYGIDLWTRIGVTSGEEAVAAADRLGYPVVLKSTSPFVRTQSVLTGVRIDLKDAAAVRAAFASLDEALAPFDANHLVVQRMARSGGVSCVVACSEDPLFGPVVRFGLAGLPTEILGDIGYRIPPLTDIDVTELMASIKGAPLLDGYRGSPEVNKAALGDVIGRVSMLVDDLAEIGSLTLNPVVAHPGGVQVLGAAVTVTRPAHRKDPGRRSLT